MMIGRFESRLHRSLEFNGYTVQLAEDGQQAMHTVTRQRPDAMVLDMTMPRVDSRLSA